MFCRNFTRSPNIPRYIGLNVSNNVIPKYLSVPLLIRRSNSDTSKLLVAISDLQEKYSMKIENFPHITVVGPQSAGKSSVLEGICGKDILPKKMVMSTMKPTHITTIRSNETKFQIGDREVKTEREAADEISRLNDNPHVTTITVIIWAPDIYNASLIDLPGLFSVAPASDPGLPKKIQKITNEYLQNPHNIPVVVHSGPADPATNPGLKSIIKFNRQEDAFGVITKLDLLETQNTDFIKQMLSNKTYPLGHGYCAVVLRNDQDISNGKTVADKLKEEEMVFKRNKLNPHGVMTMRKKISDIQYMKIRDQIPNILQTVDGQIADLKASQTFMNNLSFNDPQKMVSRIRIMIDKLYPGSIERAEFEDDLKNEFKRTIGAYIDSTVEKQQVYEPPLSKDIVNNLIMNFNSKQMVNPSDYAVDSMKEMFSFSLVSPHFITSETIKKAYNNEISLATTIPMIDPHLDDPLGKKRAQFNRKLNVYFSKLLKDDVIHKIVHDVTVKQMLQYIYRDPETHDELSKKFAEYVINEISNEVYETKIKYGVTAMLNLEKRPRASTTEYIRYVAQKYPEYFTFRGGFLEPIMKNSKKFSLEYYGDVWSEAYMKVLSDNVVENCYRNVAVNLLDPMIDKVLLFSFDIMNKERLKTHQLKINEKVEKLVEIRDIVSSYNSSNSKIPNMNSQKPGDTWDNNISPV